MGASASLMYQAVADTRNSQIQSENVIALKFVNFAELDYNYAVLDKLVSWIKSV